MGCTPKRILSSMAERITHKDLVDGSSPSVSTGVP
jgi:hypothetical protein